MTDYPFWLLAVDFWLVIILYIITARRLTKEIRESEKEARDYRDNSESLFGVIGRFHLLISDIKEFKSKTSIDIVDSYIQSIKNVCYDLVEGRISSDELERNGSQLKYLYDECIELNEKNKTLENDDNGK